jgi:hypothetical protein
MRTALACPDPDERPARSQFVALDLLAAWGTKDHWVNRPPALTTSTAGTGYVDLADGNEQRLAIFMSPQEGKSERASHYFPLWMLANNPECRIAIVSYSGEIARRWGWLLRQDIETYNGSDGNIDLGLRLGPRPPAGRFTVEGHRGGVYCVGIAGSLTGRAVDLLIIDDPIKDLEQAQSARYRDRAGLFWQAVAIPRMGPNTRTVLIQTRWHEDDLAGRLLGSEGRKESGGKWRVISIPAQCEDEATDPARAPRGRIHDFDPRPDPRAVGRT